MAATTRKTTTTKRQTARKPASAATRAAVKAKQPANGRTSANGRSRAKISTIPIGDDEPTSDVYIDRYGSRYFLRDDLSESALAMFSATSMSNPADRSSGENQMLSTLVVGMFLRPSWLRLVQDTFAAGSKAVAVDELFADVVEAIADNTRFPTE